MANRTRKRPCSGPAVKESLHFFRIILHHTIANKKLKIPNKFALKFGHELSNVSTFIVPDGRNWEIGLTKGDGIWLDEGWHEFVEYYSICYGHFLVFRYERNSTFRVFIFDQTACEVDYPIYVSSDDEELSNGENEKNSNDQDSETEDDDSVELLGAKSRNSDKRANQEANSRKQDASSQKNWDSKRQRNAAPNKNSDVRHAKVARGKRRKIGKVVDEEEVDNLNESRQIHLNKKELCSFNKSSRSKKSRLRNQNANGLHDPDVSAQLDQDLKLQFDGKELKITIQRANLQLRRSTRLGSNAQGKQEPRTTQDEEIKIFVTRKLFTSFTSLERERAIRAVQMFKPKSPCFMIILQRSNFISSNMHVPVGFAYKYLSGVSDHIKVQDSQGREWFIAIKREKRWGVYLRKGCCGFWKDNNLKRGDVCIFELIRHKEAAVHKISILHADSD